MGWQTEQFGSDHEGYPVAVMSDGTEPAPIQQEVSLPGGGTATSPNSGWWLYDGQDGRPRAFAVRAGCACGWRSPEMFPVDFEDHDETDGFEYGGGPYKAWDRQHIAPLLGTTVPDELADAIATVRRMLDGLATSRPLAAVAAAADVEKLGTASLQRAVTAVRDSHGSWEEIGQALGTSRQAAHQRFAKNLFRG
ncbi:hypothetical protein ACF1GX_30390 [Streptomyces albidoflavus]|uniref:hypothetical protein n=1 Tax=Streptomyces albidoflavus TaxID=1886 RepID=UPI00101E3F9A|nr:hypothetical protein [Streptomyces albidoflavus]RZD77126.1 hypothetical protein C0Q63_31785 [Streptomyces albidoflavus]